MGPKLVGGGTPFFPCGSKSYIIVNTLMVHKFFDFETLKIFLKDEGLVKFSKSQFEVVRFAAMSRDQGSTYEVLTRSLGSIHEAY